MEITAAAARDSEMSLVAAAVINTLVSTAASDISLARILCLVTGFYNVGHPLDTGHGRLLLFPAKTDEDRAAWRPERRQNKSHYEVRCRSAFECTGLRINQDAQVHV